MIYGTGLGVSPNSVQIPPLVAQAKKNGIARYVGQGINVWSNVHITDVVELYLLALKKAPAGAFYFVENGEASYADIVGAIAKRLKLGAPQSWPVEEAIKEWGIRSRRIFLRLQQSRHCCQSTQGTGLEANPYLGFRLDQQRYGGLIPQNSFVS